jgi:flagellar motor switch protein FliM
MAQKPDSIPSAVAAARSIQPCNFRSAGRLSNESARTLTSLHDASARNIMNSLDVYLGTGLDVKLVSLEQLSIDDYKAALLAGAYIVPCVFAPSTSSMVLEIDPALMFTMIDLLLGGSGATGEATTEHRELTEIDEEIMQGVVVLLAQQIERVWQPMNLSLTPGVCIKPVLAPKLFPPTEKVLLIRFSLTVAGMTGLLHVAFPASLGSHLVRVVRADPAREKGSVRYFPRPSLEERVLDCTFTVAADLPEVRVLVRDLSAIAPGTVLRLSAPVSNAGRLTVENKELFAAVPVRSGSRKAAQLLSPAPGASWLRE